MRNFIDILNETADISAYARMVLPAGTILYHGSNATDDFEIPEGPAWFTLNDEQADFWSGWHTSDKRNQGHHRVMTFELLRDLDMMDWRNQSYEEALEFSRVLTGDEEASPYEEAEALRGKADGWVARDEVMIIDTSCLRYVDRRAANPNAPQIFNK